MYVCGYKWLDFWGRFQHKFVYNPFVIFPVDAVDANVSDRISNIIKDNTPIALIASITCLFVWILIEI